MYNDNNNDNNNDDEKTNKLKKIRKLLLLKTDDELKKNSKKNSNLMINSKTIEDINKSYNLYNILLLEKSRIYYNFIKTEEKVYPNISLINKDKPRVKNIKFKNPTNINKDIEEEPNTPILNFFPKKIDLASNQLKRLDIPINKSIKERKYTEEKIIFQNKIINENIINKSTKIERKGLFKLVDKIVNIKMNNENKEEMIKKNIIKLRKYCNRLKKTKKNLKKINKLKSESISKKIKEKKEKKDKFNNNHNNNKKRMTITSNKNFFKKSLFGVDKIIDEKLERGEHRGNTTKSLHSKNVIKEYKKENETEKGKDKEKDKEKKPKINRVASFKVLKQMIKKDKIEQPNRKKFRKMQTLNGNFQNKLLEFGKKKPIKLVKKTEINKNDESIPSNNILLSNGTLLSSKFERPTIYFIYNNISNSNNIISFNKEQSKSKVISLFGNNNNNKNISNKEKKGSNVSHFNKEIILKNRLSTKKYNKNTSRIYDKYLHFSKKDENYQLIKLERKNSLNKDDIEEINILSDFNKKCKKKQNISPANKNDHY